MGRRMINKGGIDVYEIKILGQAGRQIVAKMETRKHARFA